MIETIVTIGIASGCIAVLAWALYRAADEERRQTPPLPVPRRRPRGDLDMGPCPDCADRVYVTKRNEPNRRFHSLAQCAARQAQLQAIRESLSGEEMPI